MRVRYECLLIAWTRPSGVVLAILILSPSRRWSSQSQEPFDLESIIDLETSFGTNTRWPGTRRSQWVDWDAQHEENGEFWKYTKKSFPTFRSVLSERLANYPETTAPSIANLRWGVFSRLQTGLLTANGYRVGVISNICEGSCTRWLERRAMAVGPGMRCLNYNIVYLTGDSGRSHRWQEAFYSASDNFTKVWPVWWCRGVNQLPGLEGCMGHVLKILCLGNQLCM